MNNKQHETLKNIKMVLQAGEDLETKADRPWTESRSASALAIKMLDRVIAEETMRAWWRPWP